jgi:hypothetical protein
LLTDVELTSYEVAAPPDPTATLIDVPGVTERVESKTSPPPPPFPK